MEFIPDSANELKLAQLAKLPAAEWLKLLRYCDLSALELENFCLTLKTVRRELQPYIDDKQEEEALDEENAIRQEVSQKGYTYRVDVDIGIREPECDEIAFYLLPIKVLIPDNLITQKGEHNQKVKAVVIDFEKQPGWMTKIPLLTPEDIITCELKKCRKISSAENGDLIPIYQTRIKFYYPYCLLEIYQQYLIITGNGEVFDCYYGNKGFYHQNEILLQINLERTGDEPISNFSHLFNRGLWTWLLAGPETKSRVPWGSCKNLSYCIIPDPAIR